MNKYIIAIPIIIILSILACQSSQKNPQDLEGKKVLLQEKKEALALLRDEIATLEKEIQVLEPPREKPPVLVNVHPVEYSIFQRFVDLQGIVSTDELVNASSETGGRIIKVYVDEGDKVKKGQLIAVTDMTILQNQLAELQTSLTMAQTVYERQKRLWEQEIGSEIQYLQAKTNKESLEKNIATLQSQLAKKNVYSPISGVVDRKFLKGGEMASPGSPIVQILNTNVVKVVADVPESYLGKLRKGDMVSIYFPALGDTMLQKVTEVGRTIDPANRTYKIEMEISNNNNILKPNLLAEVTFMDLEIIEAITLPVDFVLEEVSGQKYVYVASGPPGEQRAEKRYVTLGESYRGEAVISSGLALGETVILEGSRNVANMDRITFSEEQNEVSNGK